MSRTYAVQGCDGDGIRIVAGTRSELVAQNSVMMVDKNGCGWSRDHFYRILSTSRGLFTDGSEGGMNGNLTTYLVSDGEAPVCFGLPRPKAGVALIDGGQTRREIAGPRYGLVWERAIGSSPS